MTRTDKPKVIVTNRIHDEALRRLQELADVDMNPSIEPWSRIQLAQRLRTATAMMGFMTDSVDAAMLEQAPALRIVACALKGYDAYDVPACTERGVWLSIVPVLLTEPTAELALGLAIGLARHVRAGDALVRGGGFAGWRSQLFGTGLHGATVAVIGLGRVGSAIVERLSGFGCARILGVDPQVRRAQAEPATLPAALARADYVFVAAPLTPETRHLIDAAALAHSKPGQLMINVGRGSVVDEAALTEALIAGRIGGYAADVFGCEDWGLSDRPPIIAPALLAHPATLFTPHLGSAVTRVRQEIEARAADNIVAVLRGQAPPDAINRPARAHTRVQV
jgi:phosphonate dehydrogenase